jgi:hypothetical protein
VNWEARAAILWGPDTSPDVAETYHQMLMSRSGAERLRMACHMFSSARTIVEAGLTADGDWSDMRARVFERTYGRDFPADERETIVDALRRWERDHPDRAWRGPRRASGDQR